MNLLADHRPAGAHYNDRLNPSQVVLIKRIAALSPILTPRARRVIIAALPRKRLIMKDLVECESFS
jgi:hypothetical protein